MRLVPEMPEIILKLRGLFLFVYVYDNKIKWSFQTEIVFFTSSNIHRMIILYSEKINKIILACFLLATYSQYWPVREASWRFGDQIVKHCERPLRVNRKLILKCPRFVPFGPIEPNYRLNLTSLLFTLPCSFSSSLSSLAEILPKSGGAPPKA